MARSKIYIGTSDWLVNIGTESLSRQKQCKSAMAILLQAFRSMIRVPLGRVAFVIGLLAVIVAPFEIPAAYSH